MKALSIQQPWAWLIATGQKDIENRTWNTGYRGWFAIHAAKREPSEAEIQAIEARFRCHINRGELRYGGMIGTARLAGVFTKHRSKWFEGPFGFHITDAEPMPLQHQRGQLGWFTWPEADRPAP